MIYKYTHENDIPVECTLTLHELRLLRELTVEAVKEDGYRYNVLNKQLQDAIKRTNDFAAVHFTWQKDRIAREEKEEAEAALAKA
tara:strand:+ start:3141 stop:3395 length:255 start_codon:yes stop_codon:yes gene_type:complete